jgi:alkylation response protein AidB-like acyl-CoA dehydrogenase
MAMSHVDAGELRELAARLGDREASDPERYPVENIEELYAARVVGAPFTSALGGRDWGLTDAVIAVETIAASAPSTALVLSMPLGLAGIFALGPEGVAAEHQKAWSEQIEQVAGLYRERVLFAACNSEKGAGGSLAATQTLATRGADGAFRLRGEKILASGGRFAGRFISTAKVTQEDLPGAGIVEIFFVPTDAPGVEIMSDWDGFGMRGTESHTVRYTDAQAVDMMGFPNFLELVQPLPYWFCLFAAIPLGCARGILRGLSSPAPTSPALRLRLSEATMRYEALRAYLLETAGQWREAPGPAYSARVLRTKTFVSQEATKLAAELFALSGGRHYRRGDQLARLLADSFAGTSLRPPLALGLDSLVEQFAPVE